MIAIVRWFTVYVLRIRTPHKPAHYKPSEELYAFSPVKAARGD